jgi:hypothetical protein
VNPAHLCLGWQLDNVCDAWERGRARVPDPVSRLGEQAPNAKLRDEEVLSIRRRFEAGQQGRLLAEEYGVCRERRRRP